MTILAKVISIYLKFHIKLGAILDLSYIIARPPTKPHWWFVEAQKILCQSVEQVLRYVDFSFPWFMFVFKTSSTVLE